MTEWKDDESRWQDLEYLQWLEEIWHVEIKEEPRHLWPGQWTIYGYWQDEKHLYNKYEKEWDKRCQEVWDKEHPAIVGFPALQTIAQGDIFSTEGEDYFNWNVQTPGWSMHRNGCWQKMLIDMNDWTGKTRDQYPGIFNSYEHACKTLADYSDLLAPRFAEDYEKHLKDFVDGYKYEKK